MINIPFVSNVELLAKLQKGIQPEMDRMQAEHERVMRLIAQMPKPSEDQKRAIAEANSQAGWQRAMREVIEQAKQSSSDPKRRKSSNPTPNNDSEA